MSFHFYIKSSQPVTYQAVLTELGRNDVRIAYAEEYDLNEVFADGAKFFIPECSSRGISVNLDEDVYDVGINILASGEDYLLACQLAETLAKLCDSTIEPEDNDEMDLTTFSEHYNAEWVETSKTMGMGVLTHMVQEKSEVCQISGCMRPYYFGPDLLAAFTTDNPSEPVLYERFIQSVIKAQFIPETIRIPGVYVVTPKTGDKWEYSVILPEQEQLLVKTDFVIFYKDEADRHKIAYEEVEKFARKHFTRLDEKQYIFPEMSLEDFNAMLATFSVPEEENQKEPVKKKWWQFGKD